MHKRELIRGTGSRPSAAGWGSGLSAYCTASPVSVDNGELHNALRYPVLQSTTAAKYFYI